MRGVRSKKTSVETKTLDERKGQRISNVNKPRVEGMEANGDGGEITTAKAIQNLGRNIQELKTEIKQELMDFKNDFRNDIKQEFNNFKTEINQKLQSVAIDVRNHGTRLSEAEQRVEETETANIELRDTLLHSLKQQKLLLDKVTDLEGRSRRNNVRIYGIKEGTEGSSMLTFMDNFLKTELALDKNVDLLIQRAHRSIGPKPQDESISRSILVNFQRYDIKDQVLKAAWAKKITCGGRSVTFAHDLPTEVNNKLKEYKDIKKILKEKQIRFQTPYPAKMRIHWENGARLYNCATEAAQDMRRRGYTVDLPRTPEVDWERRLVQGPHWSKKDGDHTERIRERLKDFQRQQV